MARHGNRAGLGRFARSIAAALLVLAIATAGYNIYQAVTKAAKPAT